jgi:hypothetical protein
VQKTTPVSRLVLRQTRPLAHLAKWTLRAVFLLGAMVALVSQATAAPVVFDISAQSSEGWTVSGTVTIDTATGKVLSADLTAKDGSSTVIFDDVYYGTVTQVAARRGGPVWTRMFFETGRYSLFLTVPEATLVGFKGSALVDTLLPGGYASSIEIGDGYYSSTDIPLYGSLEPN